MWKSLKFSQRVYIYEAACHWFSIGLDKYKKRGLVTVSRYPPTYGMPFRIISHAFEAILGGFSKEHQTELKHSNLHCLLELIRIMEACFMISSKIKKTWAQFYVFAAIYK